ncbi:MAG: ABC transporter permease [Bacteroidetes bacterium]|nr:ABC transporter permease [Bacteroidota bacterium]
MINRKFKDTGITPLFAYVLLTLIFVGLSIYLFRKTEYAQYIYLFFALILIGKLSETQRGEFLKICFGSLQFKKIRILENLICSIPFIFFMLYKHLFITASILFVLIIILALINFRTHINFTIWTPFSKKPFEFVIGFRKTFYLFFIAYFMSIISVFAAENYKVGVFAMIVIFTIILSYYQKPENEYFIWIYNVNAKTFLYRKIKILLQFSTLLILPALVILSVFFHQNIDTFLLTFLIGMAFLILMILGKYSTYPNEINIGFGIIFATCIMFPFLLTIFIPYFFKKAEAQLNTVLE